MAVDWGYECYAESQNIAENYSNVRLKVWVDVSDKSYTYDWKNGQVYFNFDENQVWYQLPPNSRTEVYNGLGRYYHDATTGQCSMSFAVVLPTTPSGGTIESGDIWVTLPTIPRKTSITNYKLETASETALKVTWGTADNIDYAWWSKDNGSTWTGVDVPDGKSGNFNITGLTPRNKL